MQPRTGIALLFVLSLVIRLAYVLVLPQLPLQADARDYDRLARSVVEGRGLSDASGQPETLRPPLYPLLVAGVYGSFGMDAAHVRIVQAVLGALVPLVALWIGLCCFTTRVAWWAAAGCALYPALVAYTGLLLTESLFSLLVVLVVAASTLALRRRAVAWYALTGLLLGLAALCRAECALLALALASALLLLQAGSFRRRVATTAVLGVVFLLTLSPWTLRNYFALRAFVPLTTDGWRTLWLASYPGGWLEWKQEEPLLSIEAGAKGPLERSSRFRAAALHNLRTDPLAYLRLAARRVGLLWLGGHSNVIAGLEGRTVDSTGLTWILKVGLLALNSTVVGLGWLGLWLNRSRWRALAPLYLMLLCPSAVYVLLIAYPRYHVPLLPLLFLFGADACRRIFERRGVRVGAAG